MLKIVASAGATAFGLTAFVETIFGKSPLETAWYASEIALAALVSTAPLSPWFVRAALRKRSLWRSLVIASVGLVLIYPVFATIHVLLTDRASTISEVASAVKIVPVFAAFSAPLAWPITLLFAWLWHKRLQRNAKELAT